MTKTYEELVTELKEVVRKIEDGEIGLDESIRLYEKGAMLVKECEEVLAAAEMKITKISGDP